MRRAAALSLLGTLAFAQSPEYKRDEFPSLPGLLWEDAKTVATSPKDWTSSDWSNLGIGAAAVVGVGLVLDKTLSDAAARNASPSRDRIATNIARVGGTDGLILMGAGYLGLSLLDKDEPRSVIVDMGVATVLSQIAILPLKYGVGRVRPGDDQGTTRFRPMTSNDSFPSGHTAQAFAMASVVSMRASDPWVGYCAYGVAGLVGLSRLETRDHFASDVVAGALVGTVMGRAVVGINQRIRTRSGSRADFTFTPAFGPGYQGVAFTARF